MFSDAGRENDESYVNYCLQLAEWGALIVRDNGRARGSVADSTLTPHKHTKFMKTFNQIISNHPQLESILIPIGDGLTISKVK